MQVNRFGYTLDEAVSAEVRAEIARTPGVTTTSLAKALGLRRATLASRINGHTPFRSSELHVVATALGITASEITARAEAVVSAASEDRNRDADPVASETSAA